MGLLDDFSGFIKTPEGQGLLAATFGGLAGATKNSPINSIGRAGLAGLSGYGNAIEMQQKLKDKQDAAALHQLQLEQLRGQFARQQKDWSKQDQEDALAAKYYTPAQPGTAPIMGDSILPPELQAGILPSQGTAPKPASFDNQGYGTAMMGINPTKAISFMQATAKDDAPQVVAPGATLISGRASGYKPIFSAPVKPEGKPTKVQEYEYAKANGYKGSLEQYVSIGPALMAAAQAPLRAAQTEDIRLENDYKLPSKPASVPSGGVSVTAGGKTFTFPDQKSANNFKLKAGIK